MSVTIIENEWIKNDALLETALNKIVKRVTQTMPPTIIALKKNGITNTNDYRIVREDREWLISLFGRKFLPVTVIKEVLLVVSRNESYRGFECHVNHPDIFAIVLEEIERFYELSGKDVVVMKQYLK
ncbi:MAG: hypothetical protein WC848_03855 [Parcubacteria group bacterium]|jgi:hypothetical protein